MSAALADALSLSADGAHGSTVDTVPPQRDLAVCIDTLVVGVHCPPETAPADLGHKVMAVNLSDLAAMGARPLHALLGLCLAQENQAWSVAFAAGVREIARAHKVSVRALDVCRHAGPAIATAELHGELPHGAALTRAGARPGDRVYVTGTLGDAGLALAAWRGELALAPADAAAVRARLDRPQPRVAAGLALHGLATAAIDVSDGLVADLGHLLDASGTGAVLYAERVPMSNALRRALPPGDALRLALGAGDDYELCFTVPEREEPRLAATLPYLRCTARCIGEVTAGGGLRLLDPNGRELAVPGGWMHFR